MKRFSLILNLAFVLVALGGCPQKKQPTKPTSTRQEVRKAPTSIPAQRNEPKLDASQNPQWAIHAYDNVRKALAADDLKAATQAAKAFGEAANTETAKSQGADQVSLQSITLAAAKIVTAKDFPAARIAFGELSKHTITYLTLKPERTKGLFAFTCPMAKGYKKWFQTVKEMANPYMGKRMLKCGAPTQLTP